MKIINLARQEINQKTTNPWQNCCLSIGNFDGIHLGHKAILSQVINYAKINKTKSALLTFDPHPIFTLNKKIQDNFLITNLSQKKQILEKIGLDYLFVINFTQDIANLSADDFIKNYLIDQLKIKHLIIGYDFIFGKNKSGNANLLRSAAQKYQFDFSQISAFKNNQQQIYSSSIIRKLIKEGQVSQANELLGYHFNATSKVIKGQQKGRTIGFPTANLKLENLTIKPKYGVYHVEVKLADNKQYNAIANFGIRPTLGDDHCPLLEIHIPNFNGDIYGQEITVKFLNFIRCEQKFSSIEQLKQQIQQDLTKI